VRARTREIAASRIRLVEAADAERQRIERDLHDGVQQQVMGMRLRLDLATRALDGEEDESRRLLSTIGRQMDDLLGSVRSLSRGVYPALLTDRGLPDALRSVARQLPVPASVSAHGIGRCPQDVEVAVYFCCLEAMQNAAKHAGDGATVTVTVGADAGRLRFDVRDDGRGFDVDAFAGGHGFTNMADRLGAMGGALQVESTEGHGACISGWVPCSDAEPHGEDVSRPAAVTARPA
jgi:signal transduction histidine kinase